MPGEKVKEKGGCRESYKSTGVIRVTFTLPLVMHQVQVVQVNSAGIKVALATRLVEDIENATQHTTHTHTVQGKLQERKVVLNLRIRVKYFLTLFPVKVFTLTFWKSRKERAKTVAACIKRHLAVV